MQTFDIVWRILLMAGITYICRMLTFVLVRKKINNRFIRSLLEYLPYGVLTAMVFPAVMYSTDSMVSAVAGMIVAIILSIFKKGLLTVALSATATVFVVELLMKFVF